MTQLTHVIGQPLRLLFLMSLACSILCVAFLAAVASDANANETKIEALLLALVPEATTIEIRLPVEESSDDLRLALILANHFSVLLTGRGYTMVEGDGELIFRFSVEEPAYAQGNGRRRHVRKAMGTMQRAGLHPGILSVAIVNDSALAESGRDTYRLRVSVARTRTPPLWTAYIERSVTGAERPEIYLNMADAVMALWGQTHPTKLDLNVGVSLLISHD